MVVDQLTKKQIPNAGALFMNPKYRASGCFNSAQLSTDISQKSAVHLNPQSAVKLAQDKAKLFPFLERKGYKIPRFEQFEFLEDDGMLDLNKLEQLLEKGPAIFSKNNAMREVNTLDDILANIAHFNVPGGIILQPQLKDTSTYSAQLIPNAAGKQLPHGSRVVRDGVLSHNIPNSLGIAETILKVMKEVIDELNLDYGKVVMAVDTDGNIEIMDVKTDLRREDTQALRAYMDILHKATLTPKGAQQRQIARK